MVRHLAPVQGIKANACALALPIENRGGKKGTVPIVTNGGFGDTTGTVPFGLGKAADNSLIWVVSENKSRMSSRSGRLGYF